MDWAKYLQMIHDTSLFSKVYDIHKSASKLNDHLEKISYWTCQWKMQSNSDSAVTTGAPGAPCPSPPPSPPTSISEPKKVQQFQFQTSKVLLLQVLKNYIKQRFQNFHRVKYLQGKVDHFSLDFLKMSDT